MITLLTDETQPEVQDWPLLEESIHGEFRIFRLKVRQCASPRTGRTHPFYALDCPDWVNVVARTGEGELVLVRQFRHGTRRLTWEIPGGMVDPGETPLEAARRELLEETGFAADTWVDLGWVEPNPAIQTNRCHTFLADGAMRVASPSLDGTEEITLGLLPELEVARWIAEGHIEHSLVVAGIYRYELYQRGLLGGLSRANP